jgi:DNA repair protein RAD16
VGFSLSFVYMLLIVRNRIQTIALMLSEPRRKPSLVVAPVVALMQWKHEIETHAEGFKVTLWHGSGRMKADQLKKFDVVCTR